jgi:uncharacterized membrane protein HdeD (DUF308 family)
MKHISNEEPLVESKQQQDNYSHLQVDNTKQQTNTRLWWMEVLRGIVTFSFGILFIRVDVHFFIFILGIYLIIDGSLDMYKVARRKRASNRRVLSYLMGALSILLGLICIAFHILALLFILFIIIARIIMSGVRVIIEARRSSSRYAGLLWLYSGLLGLWLLTLIFFPAESLLFKFYILFIFISVYAICDGLYLIGRGLRLRYTSTVFTGSTSQVLQNQPELLDNIPLTTRRAVVFVRRRGANGLGHIGWAFEWKNGWFNTGSVENRTNKPYAKPEEMGFWTAHTLDPIATMRGQNSQYDEYKLLYIAQPRPKDAWKTAIWESREPYVALRHNCNDVAYDILQAYGANELVDPAEQHVPNDWFDALPGESYAIAEHPVIPLRLHKMSKRELATREILLTIPEHIQGTPPLRQQRGWRAMQELTLTWDKMLKDMRKLIISTRQRLIKRQVA